MQSEIAVQTDVSIRPITARLPALALLVFGLLMLYGVGFTTLDAVHNAAHDTRHSAGFPCH